MAEVTSINPYMPGWSGTDQAITKQFTVTLDVKTASAAVVIDSPLTPKEKDKLDENSLYVVQPGGITATRIDDNPYQWRLTVVYSKTGFSFASRDDSDRLISFNASTRVYTHTPTGAWEFYNPVTKYRRRFSNTPGIPIVNSLGDRFDPSDIQDEYYNTVLNWTQRENAKFDYIDALENKGSINLKETTILGIKIARGAGLMRQISPELSVDENGDFEWVCSYSCEIADDKDFWIKVLDRGFYALIDGAKKEITNGDIKRNLGQTATAADNATPASEPQPLNGQGALAAWVPATSSYDTVYLEYRTKRRKNWTKTLNLIAEQIRTS